MPQLSGPCRATGASYAHEERQGGQGDAWSQQGGGNCGGSWELATGDGFKIDFEKNGGEKMLR